MANFIIKFLTIFAVISTVTCTCMYKGVKCELTEIILSSSTRQKRSANETITVSLKVFNKEIRLNLKPVDDVIVRPTTPVYNIQRAQSVLKIKQSTIFKNMRMELYEDEQNFASAAVNIYPNGVKTIENAIIGAHNLIIRPATKKLLHDLNKRNNKYNVNNIYVVYTRKNQVGHFLNPLEKKWTSAQSHFQQLVRIPDVIYPEVLIIVDYKLMKNYPENNILPYLLAFWNQVDMIYRSLSSPKYKITIAGIVIAQDPKALDYIERSARSQYGSKQLSFSNALTRCGRWLYTNQKVIPIDSYDMAITMTSTESDARNFALDGVFGQEIGLAALSGACKIDHFFKTVLKAGIFLDNGDFSGVITAAHELGHTLGSRHDDGICYPSSGYVMSPTLSQTLNRFSWSKCTLRDFKNFLSSNPSCLFNKPR